MLPIIIGAIIAGGAHAAGLFALGATIFQSAMIGASIGSLFMREKVSPTYELNALETTSSNRLPIPIIYGRNKVAGNIIYSTKPGPKTIKGEKLQKVSDYVWKVKNTNLKSVESIWVIVREYDGPNSVSKEYTWEITNYEVDLFTGEIIFETIYYTSDLGPFCTYTYQPTTVKKMDLCVAFGEGPVQSITDIRVNDMPIDDIPGATYTVYLGTPTQNPDSRNPNNEAFRNVAYVAMTLEANEYISGNVNVTAIVEGLEIRVWDRREMAWVTRYSRNPVWCVLDLLTSRRYGLRVPDSKIDFDSFIEAAQYADQMTTAAPGETSDIRFQYDRVFDTIMNGSDALGDILATFGGFLIYEDGKITLRVERSQTPVQDFDMDSIVKGSFSYFVPKRKDIPNRVTVMFVDPDSPDGAWRQEPIIADDELDQEISGEVRNKTIQLLGIHRASQAGRRARYFLDSARLCNKYCSFAVSPNSLLAQVGDVITVTHDLPGWVEKQFMIMEIQEDQTGDMFLLCREYRPEIYHDGGVPYTPGNDTVLPNPFRPPLPVENLSLLETYEMLADGTWIPQIQVNWTKPDDINWLYAVIYTMREGAKGWTTAAVSYGESEIITVGEPGTYRVLVRSVGQGGKENMWEAPTATITVLGKDTPPSDVTWGDCTFTDRIILRWNPVPDKDVKAYEVRLNQGFGSDDEYLVYRGNGLSYTIEKPTQRSYTFYLKALDRSGNYSNNVAQKTIENTIPSTPPPPVVEAFFSSLKIRILPVADNDIVAYNIYLTPCDAQGTSTGDPIVQPVPYPGEYPYEAPSGSSFLVQVAACDILGEGQKSAAVLATTKYVEDVDIPEGIIEQSKLTESLSEKIDTAHGVVSTSPLLAIGKDDTLFRFDGTLADSRQEVFPLGYEGATKTDYGLVVGDNLCATLLPDGGVSVAEGTTNLVTDQSEWALRPGAEATQELVSQGKWAGWYRVHVTKIGTSFGIGRTQYIDIPIGKTHSYSIELYSESGRISPHIWGFMYVGEMVHAGSNRYIYTWTNDQATSGDVAIWFRHNELSEADTDEVFYYRYVQVEAKPYPTSFVEGTRPAGRLLYQLSINLNNDFAIHFKCFTEHDKHTFPAFLLDDDNHNLYLYKGASTYTLRAIDSTGNTRTINYTPSSMLGEYSFIITRTGNKISFYVNGNLINAMEYEWNQFASKIWVGTRSGGANHGSGTSFQNLLIRPYAVSPETIKAWYNLNAPFFDPAAIETKAAAHTSQIQQLSNEITLKVQKIQDGKTIVTGIGIASGDDQSEVAILADRFRIFAAAEDGQTGQAVFAVDTQTQKVYLLGDMIADGTITARMISTEELITKIASIDEAFIDSAHIISISADKITVGGSKAVIPLSIDSKRGDMLWHFDSALATTKGQEPEEGAVASIVPNEGVFGGAVVIEKGTINLLPGLEDIARSGPYDVSYEQTEYGKIKKLLVTYGSGLTNSPMFHKVINNPPAAVGSSGGVSPISTPGRGLLLTAIKDCYLDTCDIYVYPGAAAPAKIVFKNLTDGTFEEKTVNIIGPSNPHTKQNIELGFFVEAGKQYELYFSELTSLIETLSAPAGASFPYTNGHISITGPNDDSGNYYYFFNIQTREAVPPGIYTFSCRYRMIGNPAGKTVFRFQDPVQNSLIVAQTEEMYANTGWRQIELTFEIEKCSICELELRAESTAWVGDVIQFAQVMLEEGSFRTSYTENSRDNGWLKYQIPTTKKLTYQTKIKLQGTDEASVSPLINFGNIKLLRNANYNFSLVETHLGQDYTIGALNANYDEYFNLAIIIDYESDTPYLKAYKDGQLVVDEELQGDYEMSYVEFCSEQREFYDEMLIVPDVATEEQVGNWAIWQEPFHDPAGVMDTSSTPIVAKGWQADSDGLRSIAVDEEGRPEFEIGVDGHARFGGQLRAHMIVDESISRNSTIAKLYSSGRISMPVGLWPDGTYGYDILLPEVMDFNNLGVVVNYFTWAGLGLLNENGQWKIPSNQFKLFTYNLNTGVYTQLPDSRVDAAVVLNMAPRAWWQTLGASSGDRIRLDAAVIFHVIENGQIQAWYSIKDNQAALTGVHYVDYVITIKQHW